MLTVTDAAAQHLNSLLENANAAENLAARITLEGKDVVMRLDEYRDEDTTFEHNGRTVLVMDEQASTVLSDEKLDVKATDDGPQLYFP